MPLRYLAHPGLLVALLFVGQFAFWALFMPETATIPGAADKYFSEAALVRWVLLFLAMLGGIWLGTLMPLGFPNHRASVANRARAWWRWLMLALTLSAFGEVVYVRFFLNNPELFLEALDQGNLAILGERVRAERIVGLSSLNNLFILGTAILASLVFHPELPKKEKRKALRWLLGLGFVVLAHSLFLAARMFFVYYLFTVAAAYLVLLSGTRRIRFRAMVVTIVLTLVVLWVGELLRGGFVYSRQVGASLLSWDVQSYVWARLVQGYLAADFNNALVVLDCEPGLQLWTTTMFASFLSDVASYSTCPGWESSYATVNVLALWWFDWGYGAFLVAFLVGVALGLFYKWRMHLRSLGPLGLLYLISFPGIFSILRINYFFLTIFVVPFAVLLFIAMSEWLSRNLRGVRHGIIR